jgi:hypothetical protein
MGHILQRDIPTGIFAFASRCQVPAMWMNDCLPCPGDAALHPYTNVTELVARAWIARPIPRCQVPGCGGSTQKIRELGCREALGSLIRTTPSCSDGSPSRSRPRSASHSFIRPPSFVAKMRVIRAATALSSGCAAGSRQAAVRYAGLACRAAVSAPSPQCYYNFRLSGLRHFSRSPVSRAMSAAEAAYAHPNPSLRQLGRAVP